MVYIHGGGFVNNNADLYPPNYLMERDIILVVIQFRLGILGNFYQNSFIESCLDKNHSKQKNSIFQVFCQQIREKFQAMPA